MNEPSSKAWAEHWGKVGPKLEAIRRHELRNFDHQRERAAIDALLEMAVAHAVPRTTSGLVEWQRRLRKLYS
ncbi:MAG: hypothetical protein HON53_07035 [Planctomycetaceae bacterium]|nr:hypothetical protein [Planctomycetaceae bacterium]MBT6155269.1 hypothetical protein [Planctomycetaceae bacterium]MBT6485235.1 hypothetical protein [Planctomycetaceae bacterium]MBT6497424.1 hypothetical protein [Planctomycetaceae bacterium]